MSIPQPRYNIGDVVYKPYTGTTTACLPCPDCHDTRKWHVKSPAGLETTIPCPRCAVRYSYSRADLPSLEYTQHTAAVEALTIGSIEVRTHPYSDEDCVKYMCNETGIGCGYVYGESKLYATREEALAVAQEQADAANDAIATSAEQLERLDMSDYTINIAALKLLRDGMYDAWRAYRSLREDVEGLLSDENTSDLKEALEDAINFDAKYRSGRKGKLEPVLDAAFIAAETGDMTQLRAAIAALPEGAAPKVLQAA